MNLERELTKRFKTAIRKSLPRCPLIGPKWFDYSPDGKPAHFRFTRVDKLVKATGMNAKVLAKRIANNLDLEDLNADVKIIQDQEIRLTLKQGKSVSSE